MSTVLNRLKLIDSVLGNGNYNRRSYSVDEYFTFSDAEAIINNILCNEERPMNLDKLCFLNIQNKDMIETIKKYMNENVEKVEKYFSYIDYYSNSNFPKIDSDEKLRAFDLILNSNYMKAANLFLSKISSDSDYTDFEKLINLAIDRNYSTSQYSSNSLYVSSRTLMEIFLNKNIMALESKDIDSLVRVVMDCFDGDFDELKSDDIEVLKDPMGKYIANINSDELIFAKRFGEILLDDDMYEFRNKSYFCRRYKEEVMSLLDTIMSEISDDVERRNISMAIMNAMDLFIIDAADINLINNKIKYGSRFLSSLSVGLELTNISEDKYREINMNFNYLEKLVSLKKIVSKGFYRRVINSQEILKSLYKLRVDIIEELIGISELGQFNDNQILKIFDYMYSSSSSIKRVIQSMHIDYKLSFDELDFIINKGYLVNKDFLGSIKNLKQTQRLLKLKEHAEINKIIQDESFVISIDGVKEFVKDIDIKSEMKKNNPLRIRDIKDFIEFSVINNKFKVNSIEELNKVKFICKFMDINQIKDLNMNDIDEKIWQSTEVKSLINQLDLSEEFKRENKENILKFCLSDDFYLTTSYLKNYRTKDIQKRGILLITKAIMANKYEDLKFVKSDIKKEISMDITNEAFESWKRTDVLERNSYVIKDVSDFSTIMRMGEIPVRSCMNYRDGMYSHCLLSNFDTSKKMITIHKNGKYVGRAILRLTVMSDNNTEETHLDFIDVDSQQESIEKCNSKKLIIFLEKAYTTLDEYDFKEVYPMIIELLKEKANEMNATVVASRNYSRYVQNDCSSEYKYVFITASKNGAQYLDSFDGSTSSAYCYKSGDVYVY